MSIRGVQYFLLGGEIQKLDVIGMHENLSCLRLGWGKYSNREYGAIGFFFSVNISKKAEDVCEPKSTKKKYKPYRGANEIKSTVLWFIGSLCIVNMMGQGEGRTHEQGVWLIWQKGNVEDDNPSHQETLATKNFVGVLLSLTTSLPLIHPYLHYLQPAAKRILLKRNIETRRMGTSLK